MLFRIPPATRNRVNSMARGDSRCVDKWALAKAIHDKELGTIGVIRASGPRQTNRAIVLLRARRYR